MMTIQVFENTASWTLVNRLPTFRGSLQSSSWTWHRAHMEAASFTETSATIYSSS